ncbi:MAG TPA: N-acetylglutaminylglutamine amidotransferase [Chromatiaceae bacterium]|nr:N-acetylglutaminylglutamine amidotransferase [Chromatiaceae bacterium]HIO13997.1 N-acetylglutaminylglutamine amidotransferase [Chromatiales bacterium]
MCGLTGEFRFDGQRPDAGRLALMTAQLAFRGPDHEALYQSGPVALGHRRLAIIDLEERSNQPLLDRDTGNVIVFNGAIYNYQDLRTELRGKGHCFATEGDTETILKAYAEWGDDCVTHLDGMFAFAIWDSRRQQLFLARDRLGIKPLYFARVKGAVRFASNTRALLAGGEIDTSVDPVALHYQLTLHGVVPAPHTILNGICKLSPATTLSIAADGSEVLKTYWTLQPQSFASSMSKWEWYEQVRETLTRAVEKRSRVADVPVGVLLSGGLDSSLLVALLAEQGVKDLRTYSIGFESIAGELGDEFHSSDCVAEHFSTRHEKLMIPNGEVLARLPEAVSQMAEPMFAQDAIGFYLLSEWVAKETKVVQSGQGADEVFAGYFWYPQMHEAGGDDDVDRFGRHYFDRDHHEFMQTVQSPYHGTDHSSELVRHHLSQHGGDSFLNRVLSMDVTMLVVDDPVKRVDNMTMAWGLEARVPFLDQQLVELAASMPPALKLGQGGKEPLKVLARGMLPDQIVNSPKHYFPVPALKYVRGEFLECMRSVLLSDRCRQRGVFEPAYVNKVLNDPEAHLTPLRGSKLWHLAVLEYWLQINVEDAQFTIPAENKSFLAACS